MVKTEAFDAKHEKNTSNITFDTLVPKFYRTVISTANKQVIGGRSTIHAKTADVILIIIHTFISYRMFFVGVDDHVGGNVV